MKPTIAFVSDSPLENTDVWLEYIRTALPEENVVPFDEINADDRAHIDVAIVADPDPIKLKALPSLKWVQSLWAGVEKMMKELADAPFEIVRLEDPEMARSMSEAVLAWTLYLHRDMPIYTAQQRQKIWKEQPHNLSGDKHVGFLGLGNLALASAQALQKQRFTVSGWSRTQKHIEGIETYSGADGLSLMLGKIDILVCLIPLTAETSGLMDEKRFSEMQQGASVINFARGPIINTEALLAVLDQGHLKHAVLDVFDVEPLPESSPLWSHERITILPHISGPTNRQTGAKIAADNIKAYRQTGVIPKAASKALGY